MLQGTIYDQWMNTPWADQTKGNPHTHAVARDMFYAGAAVMLSEMMRTDSGADIKRLHMEILAYALAKAEGKNPALEGAN